MASDEPGQTDTENATAWLKQQKADLDRILCDCPEKGQQARTIVKWSQAFKQR